MTSDDEGKATKGDKNGKISFRLNHFSLISNFSHRFAINL